MRKTILNSLKESVKTIKQNKLWFAILFFTHLVFILMISYFFMHYSVQIGLNAQQVIEPLQNISAAITPADTDVLFEGAGAISIAYNQMMHSILMLGLLSFLTYLIVNGFNWGIANRIVHCLKSCLDCFKNLFMYMVATLVFAAIGAVLGVFFMSIVTAVQNKSIATLIMMILVVIVSYFAYIAYSLVNFYMPKQVLEFLKHTFVLGYKKFGVLMASYFLVWLPIVLVGWLIYKFLFAAMPLLILSNIIFVLLLAWSKIFFVTVVKNSR